MDDDDLSPRKRSPRALEGDNEDESPSKRQAVEEEEEAVEEEVEEDAVEEEEEAEEVEEAVEDNAAVDDETPTEESTSNPRQITKAPEAGIIKEVYVENFMCHAKFRVKFCRNVNFITGQNG